MNYIVHHGIKGQRWGVRRYQNEDGSYKPGAEGRYYDEEKSPRQLRREERRRDRINEIQARRNRNKAAVKESNTIIDSYKHKGFITDKRADKLRRENNADLKYTEIYNKYKIAKQKAKLDPSYKNSSEYQRIRKAYGKQTTDSMLYGRLGTERIYRDMEAGKSYKEAKRKETGRTVATSLIVAGVITAAAIAVENS